MSNAPGIRPRTVKELASRYDRKSSYYDCQTTKNRMHFTQGVAFSVRANIEAATIFGADYDIDAVY